MIVEGTVEAATARERLWPALEQPDRLARALPHVDDFLPARDLRSLQALARYLGAIPRRRRARLHYGAVS